MKEHFLNFEADQYTRNILGINWAIEILDIFTHMPFFAVDRAFDYKARTIMNTFQTVQLKLFKKIGPNHRLCAGKLLKTLSSFSPKRGCAYPIPLRCEVDFENVGFFKRGHSALRKPSLVNFW